MDIEKNNGKKRRKQSKFSYHGGGDESKVGKGLRKNDRRKARHSSKQFIKQHGEDLIDFD